VILKRFHVTSNSASSRKHGSLGIVLKTLRSLCFSIYQTAYSTRGRSINISYTKTTTFAFSLSLACPRLFVQQHLPHIPFSKSDHWEFS
jgi:hypothetical protein